MDRRGRPVDRERRPCPSGSPAARSPDPAWIRRRDEMDTRYPRKRRPKETPSRQHGPYGSQPWGTRRRRGRRAGSRGTRHADGYDRTPDRHAAPRYWDRPVRRAGGGPHGPSTKGRRALPAPGKPRWTRHRGWRGRATRLRGESRAAPNGTPRGHSARRPGPAPPRDPGPLRDRDGWRRRRPGTPTRPESPVETPPRERTAPTPTRANQTRRP